MTKKFIDRIKIAAETLDIPQDAVDHVIKNGSSRHRTAATDVLLEFARIYGVSLDYLISDNPESMLRQFALINKRRSDAA